MPAIRHLLSCALLLFTLTSLAGCEMFSADAWNRPSPLSGHPPPPEEEHERQGGFTVLVGAPDQPTAARVTQDIAAFAQARGFVRQTSGPSQPNVPVRYVLGGTGLDVVYRTTDLRIVAFLHGFKLNRNFVNQFYQDFDRKYGGQYGVESPMFEDEELDAASGLPGGETSGGARGREVR